MDNESSSEYTADILEEAKRELAAEDRRDAIDRAKERLRTQRSWPLWKRLFPYRVIILKEEKL